MFFNLASESTTFVPSSTTTFSLITAPVASLKTLHLALPAVVFSRLLQTRSSSDGSLLSKTSELRNSTRRSASSSRRLTKGTSFFAGAFLEVVTARGRGARVRGVDDVVLERAATRAGAIGETGRDSVRSRMVVDNDGFVDSLAMVVALGVVLRSLVIPSDMI